MAGPKTKYDPLEAAKLGTDQPPPAAPEPIPTPRTKAAVADFDTSDLDEPVVKRRPRYTVLKDKQVSIRGMLCSFKAGRVIDSAGYDVEQLKVQGLELELIKE